MRCSISLRTRRHWGSGCCGSARTSGLFKKAITCRKPSFTPGTAVCLVPRTAISCRTSSSSPKESPFSPLETNALREFRSSKMRCRCKVLDRLDVGVSFTKPPEPASLSTPCLHAQQGITDLESRRLPPPAMPNAAVNIFVEFLVAEMVATEEITLSLTSSRQPKRRSPAERASGSSKTARSTHSTCATGGRAS